MFLTALVVCVFFAIFSFRADKSGPRPVLTPALSATLAAALLAALILASVIVPLSRQGDSVIAWTGIETAGSQLVVGDSGAHQTLGWPNGAFAPVVRISCPATGNCSTRIEGGGAFVISGDRILNGESVERDKPIRLDGYQVALVSGVFELPFHIEMESSFARPRFRVEADGFSVFSANLDRDRKPDTMDHLLSGALAELRRDSWNPNQQNRAKIAMDLERWSSDLRVLPAGRNAAWVLSASASPSPAEIAIPAKLEILWPTRTLHANLDRAADGAISLRFEGPWPRSSPIPPQSAGRDGQVTLTVTDQPHPDDIAFLLPFGGDTPVRQTASMRDGLFETAAESRARGNAPPIPKDLTSTPVSSGGELSDTSVPRSSSATRVPVGEQTALLETVRVQPRFWLLLLGVVAAWLTLAFALDVTLRAPKPGRYQKIEGIRLTDRRLLAALSVVVWTFLLLRLGLSLRYAQDAAYLDRVVVEGVTWSLFGLATLPGLMLRSAMMWLPRIQDPNAQDGWRLRWLTGVIVAVGAAEVVLVEYGFWPALRDEFRRVAGVSGWAIFLLALAIVFLWNWVRTNHEYFWGEREEPEDESGRKLEDRLHTFVRDVSTRFASFARDPDFPLWKNLSPDHKSSKDFWRLYGLIAASVFAFVVVFAIIYKALQAFFPGVEPLKEVFAPLLLCLPPVCYLLNSRVAFPAGETDISGSARPEWLRAIFVTGALVILLAIVYPVALHDAGAFVVTFALFAPTALILVMGGSPGRIAWLTAGFLSLGFLAAGLVTLEFVPAMAFGAIKPRVVEFRNSANVDQLLGWYAVGQPDSLASDPPLSAARMRQTHQHLWEMQAIARYGGVTGRGFGQAPVRNSQVRQDTLQYDSTFSFFVLSEHGLIGGFALICLYAMPLVLVLISARRKLDVGHGLALVIACSFFLEGLAHALMNVGALPETGRSMPLLAVKSISDLLRWMIFFRVMAQALMWRVDATEAGYTPDPALLPEPAPGARFMTPYGRTCLVLGGGAALLVVALVTADVNVIRDDRLKELTWKGLLDATNAYITNGTFVLKGSRIEPNGIKPAGELLFLQEMARFNELTDAEKLTGLSKDDARRFCEATENVHDLAGYDKLMSDLRHADRPTLTTLRPSLFLLRPDDEASGDEDALPRVAGKPGGCVIRPEAGYKLSANPAFVSRTTFEQHRGVIPRVYLGKNGRQIMGPAWVEGAWVGALNQDAPIPWLEYLRTGIIDGSFNPLPDASGKVELTLDPQLQAAAQEFLALRGRERHGELLAGRSPESPGDVEPPRVALSIVNLKNGEVLALGGYPRMTASPAWRSDAATHELIPPSRWVGQKAPASIRSRYGSDRNFDRLLMGSSTKPIWASAALGVNKDVDTMLGVRGPSGQESEIFGIQVGGKPWEIDAESVGLNGGWCDFTSYLARSDNRYHIRLGFLSLANWSGGKVEEGGQRPAPAAGDATETINMSSVWSKYPVFPADIGFSPDHPRTLRNLASQKLAIQLRDMFGIHVSSTDGESVRSSFWTGNEDDDKGSAALGLPMQAISPERVNMELDRVQSPRDFVTLLLGGKTNRWSNVDFAGAFASAVLGHPMVPHIVRLQAPAVSRRADYPDIAKKLRPGLEAAYSNSQGTVWKQLGSSGRDVRDFLSRHPEYKVYAKTGTLPAAKGQPNTSRLVFTMVHWSPGQTDLKSGLVFSIVVDRGATGLAAEWLGQFIHENEGKIIRALQD